jgi:MFS transporter, UMF1 family
VLAQLWHTLRTLPHQRGVLWFLLARMLYTDALTTIFAFGGVYAAGTFGMDAREVLVLGIVLNLTAGLGALAFAPLDDRLGSRRTVTIALWALIATTAVLLAVRTPAQFLVAAAVLGALVGPVQAASRTLLTRIAPVETRAQLFGLYAFSGKATAFLGPFLVAALTAASGSQRAGLAVVLVLLAGGLGLLRGVPEPRGVNAQGYAAPAPPPR